MKVEEEKIKKIYNSFSLDNNEIDKRISKNNFKSLYQFRI